MQLGRPYTINCVKLEIGDYAGATYWYKIEVGKSWFLETSTVLRSSRRLRNSQPETITIFGPSVIIC